MPDLGSLAVPDTYGYLLHVPNPVDTTFQQVVSGRGVASPLKLATDRLASTVAVELINNQVSFGDQTGPHLVLTWLADLVSPTSWTLTLPARPAPDDGLDYLFEYNITHPTSGKITFQSLFGSKASLIAWDYVQYFCSDLNSPDWFISRGHRFGHDNSWILLAEDVPYYIDVVCINPTGYVNSYEAITDPAWDGIPVIDVHLPATVLTPNRGIVITNYGGDGNVGATQLATLGDNVWMRINIPGVGFITGGYLGSDKFPKFSSISFIIREGVWQVDYIQSGLV